MADQRAEATLVRRANDAFYQALSAGSIEGISAASAHDDGVTALHEASKEVAIGWEAVLESWKAVPFHAFSALLVTMPDPVVRVSGQFAYVAGLEKVSGAMKGGATFSWIALGTNIFEKRDGEWLIVHHHASKAAEDLVG